MSKNIMIVDDSATMLMSLRSSLEMSGFKVEAANDGVQAIGKLKGGYKPDLIITDINMPNMGGLELIGKARALPGMRFVPILALTTESQQSKRDEAKKNGATGWLVKPVGAADLLKVIKQVLPGA
jgi:two-component system chemotaxis response regulator CheY